MQKSKRSSDGTRNKPCEWGELALSPKREVSLLQFLKSKASNPKHQKCPQPQPPLLQLTITHQSAIIPLAFHSK